MKKKILSDDAYHSVWLQVGIKKLRSLKAAKLTGKRTMAFDEAEIPGRQSSDLVIVEVRATDSETSDEVKVTQIPPSMYFGFGAQVEMRCKCRGIVIGETAGSDRRAAVFLTDGTELASLPITVNDPSGGTRQGLFHARTKFAPTRRKVIEWSGGGEIPFGFGAYDSNADSQILELTDIITFTVPDDVCYKKEERPENPSWRLLATAASKLNSIFTDGWDAAQAAALVREQRRRKKCSEGQIAYLRNGFLSPEFEYFIKTTAPISTSLRAKYEMQIIERSQVLSSDIDLGGGNTSKTYTASVTLKFVRTDGQELLQTISGTLEVLRIAHKNSGGLTVVTSTRYTYTNFPMLDRFDTGAAYELPPPLPNLPYPKSLILNSTQYHIRDASIYPVMVEANGEFLHTDWLEYNTYAAPKYSYEYPLLTPTVEKTKDEVVFSHPQFILEYIEASKPIESEINGDGNKVPVIPSTEWLSSRLADKEVIKVIPLNFINLTGENFGMFPLNTVNDINENQIEQLCVYGYAEVQYEKAIASFTFRKWIEFIEGGTLTIKIDDEVTMDDELEPTTITVVSGGATNTYNLAPKIIPYDEEWGRANCVCITSKVKWTDIKAQHKDQKKRIAESFEPEAPDELTPEEALYAAVKKAIA